MKVFVDLRADEAGSQPRYQLAITLPAKWLQLPSSKLLETYVKQYNAKFPENILASADWALFVKDVSPFARTPWKKVGAEALMGDEFTERHEIWVGKAVQAADMAKLANANTCKNYGCQLAFAEAENHDDACCHHVGAPVFHDTRKYWSCCDQLKVYEFEELLQLPGCTRGRHSLTPPQQERIANEALREQTARVAERAERINTDRAQTVESGPASVPTPAAKVEPPRPKPPQLPPGFGRCKHYGCQKDFALGENGPTACRHHPAAPFFHDGHRKWTCCGATRWDFDEFIAIPGCVTGPHEAVVFD